ncbi:glycoside hydrolase [Kitasatospora viridis]|uniref:Glycosyl hydrolase family 101 n=1 Tax=Kitasatospora viridis TaxID=281105 RepID=A0A561ULU7_9ACTN|nr:glycoside hydrolase [Kitasatospora viridis]TWG00356.1 glycosyl hydrolase family 101 [Kitasatospora viridis]
MTTKSSAPLPHPRPARRGAALAALALAGTATLTGAGSPAARAADRDRAPRVHGNVLEVPVDGGVAELRTDSLAVTARTRDGRTLTLSAPAAQPLGSPGRVTVRAGTASWTLPGRGLSMTAAAVAGRLQVTVHDEQDGATLAWPVTGTDPSAAQLQLPSGEGLGIPVADPFWNSATTGVAGASYGLESDLSMPLWGYTLAGAGVSYLVPQPIGTSLGLASQDGRLRGTAVHTFARRENTQDYTVTIALTAPTPTAPAQDYRRWLGDHGELVTLRSKIAANPEVGKLLGAFHAYLWGSARTAQGVQRMQALGLSRLWLGYDSDDQPMDAQAVAAAERAGYLVGPYDSFANAQDPATADAPTSVWPAPVYPDYCIHRQDGSVLAGFHDRGCYLSSQAFAQHDELLARRTAQLTANGANSYFLDVDAAGELYDDFSAGHPMNQQQDEANRLARMRRLSGPDQLVLGSESARSWAAPVLAFSHGSLTPTTAGGLWALERDKNTWGGYAPAGAPGTFFKPVTLPADLATAMFDPRYRIPLLETALHDSQVNLDRWELSYTKFPALEGTRALQAVLQDTPLNLVLDGPTLTADGTQLAALQQYFAPLHEAAGTRPMTGFGYLSADHLVQRSTFGDGDLQVTANFGTTSYGPDALPGGCVDARLKGDAHPRRLCPATLPGVPRDPAR